MYTIISTFINTFGILYLTNYCCEYLFPEKTSTVKQYMLWKGMQYYTMIEMRVNKYIKLLDPIITYIFPPIKREDLLFIKNGEIVKKYYFDELFKDNDTFNNTEFPAFEFILYFIKLKNNEKFDYNVLRFNSREHLMSYNYKQLLYFKDNKNIVEHSSLKLLALQVKLKSRVGESIAINFGRYNYFIESNVILDRPFIVYFLKSSYNITLGDNEIYEVSFIDKDMNLIKLNEEHRVEVKNNSYVIWINGVNQKYN